MTLQFNMAELQRQWPLIAVSRLNAIRRIIGEAYLSATGLDGSDPPELWHFAMAKSEPRQDPVSKEGVSTQKGYGDHIRQYDPAYDADKNYEADQQWLAQLGPPNLRETVLSLANTIKDEVALARHLSTLLDLHRRPPITQEQYEEASKDADDTTRFLVDKWIQDPPGKQLVGGSLCFYSDRAMAKLVFRLIRRKQLPLHEEIRETERIKKIYRRMGLVPGSPRLIRDVQFKRGGLYPVFYKAARRQQW